MKVEALQRSQEAEVKAEARERARESERRRRSAEAAALLQFTLGEFDRLHRPKPTAPQEEGPSLKAKVGGGRWWGRWWLV